MVKIGYVRASKQAQAASDLGGRHNPRYFGRRRGLTLYNHVNNRGAQYWIDVVNCTMREATYVLDGLLYQDAPEIKEHYTVEHWDDLNRIAASLKDGLIIYTKERMKKQYPATFKASVASERLDNLALCSRNETGGTTYT